MPYFLSYLLIVSLVKTFSNLLFPHLNSVFLWIVTPLNQLKNSDNVSRREVHMGAWCLVLVKKCCHIWLDQKGLDRGWGFLTSQWDQTFSKRWIYDFVKPHKLCINQNYYILKIGSFENFWFFELAILVWLKNQSKILD